MFPEWYPPTDDELFVKHVHRYAFLGQALGFHVADLYRVRWPDLRWRPRFPRLGPRESGYAKPTLANDAIQLDDPLRSASMLRSVSLRFPDAHQVWDLRRSPQQLATLVDLVTHDPLPYPKPRKRPATTTVARPGDGSAGKDRSDRDTPGVGSVRVQPMPTEQPNPLHVFVYRSRHLLDEHEPTRRKAMDPRRLRAGLQALCFTLADQHPDDGPPPGLTSEWVLDTPAGDPVAMAVLTETDDGRRPRQRRVARHLEVRLEPEADDGLTPQQRAQGRWWHAGVMSGLQRLADDLGARLATRDELDDAWQDHDD